ncbi:MAG: amino acid permease [Bdellovibrionaceae bacterium]|nr:amino acid permease [Pseudobdellovibrionaceae bacterium]MBX3033866.1 amino acid permease [Pseudobdellovibrionaceae bacterium]
MKAALDRRLGWVALTIYGVGDILGAGIYGLVGKAVGVLGNAVWMAFLAGLVAAALTGLSYASLSSRFPKAAGSSFVVLKAFGSSFGAYVIGLAAMASGLTSMAAASRVFSGYLGGFTGLPLIPGAILFLSFLGFIVWRGLRETSWLNIVCTTIEVSGLLIVIAVCLPFWGNVDYLDMKTAGNPAGDFSVPLLLSAVVLVFYSFVGFEDLINLGEEAKDPTRDLPKAFLLALSIASLIYLAVSVSAVSVLPAAELAQSPQPLVDVVSVASPGFPPWLFSLIALFAVMNTALLNFVMGSRLLYGLSRLRIMPKFLDQVHATRKTPVRAVLTVYVIAVILALSGDISTLARATSLLLLLVFVLMNLSLIRLKMRPVGAPPPFDVPLIIPVLGAAICFGLLMFGQMKDYLVAGGLLAVIVVLYFVMRPDGETIRKMMEMEES